VGSSPSAKRARCPTRVDSVGVDTYLVIPARDPEKARRALDPDRSELTQMGTDYVVLYLPERFEGVREETARYGSEIAASMPPAIRKALDPRGIAAYAEVGQAFADPTYEALLARQGEPLWLPTARPRRKPGAIRVLLVAISAARETLLMADPALVKDIVGSHRVAKIPGSLDVEHWVELQRTLFDALTIDGTSDGDPRADAVAPRGGLPLYEDKNIDGAKLVRAPEVARTAEWLASLPRDVVAQLRGLPKRSENARLFPNTLGAAPADDDGRLRSGTARAKDLPPAVAVQEELVRLLTFYDDLRKQGRGVLSIRYRS
jgi:hypothetical protein